ncbi:hypothetical protein CEXT_244181 [Caerostris extrusa]|uniref:Uncharacterized protein n=1 Tax=Caerostris extrusa TaxID=172846 RepID=A0AAV4UUP9_CAEEX|nr:hypothetical protein CEXT_244181 [Caerostris extrusa]
MVVTARTAAVPDTVTAGSVYEANQKQVAKETDGSGRRSGRSINMLCHEELFTEITFPEESSLADLIPPVLNEVSHRGTENRSFWKKAGETGSSYDLHSSLTRGHVRDGCIVAFFHFQGYST